MMAAALRDAGDGEGHVMRAAEAERGKRRGRCHVSEK